MKNRLSKKREIIDRLNDEFDKHHYLEKRNRSIASLYKMLRYKSIEYKKSIEAAQKELTLSTGVRQRYTKYDLVACSIAGKHGKFFAFGTSLKVLSSYNKKLHNKLIKLGKIGTPSNHPESDNIIGKCAEVKTANHIINANKKLEILDITFTAAIRPRTLEKISRCPNCVYVFGEEK
ncbi:hypothetical protein I6L40_15105 [Aeromonas sp. FDAARGOS 1410]|uniref:hypothetical protein n=1 Tax=Aeromonas TaxID=642 RepID=UPI001C246491|nr:hypothetical protein [Aeromonas sp. FDAARGOS 1410]QXC37228.1 hypothetical protein I6L40_15105 [Aeromonas sp. FDAARGOS 1410]